MNVYVLVVEDRHADTGIELFTNYDAALEQAFREIPDNWQHEGDEDDPELGNQTLTDGMEADGWLFYFRYSCEGDHVRIMLRVL